MPADDWRRAVKNLRRIADKSGEYLGNALTLAAENLMSEAIPITPFDTGDLRRSGYVSQPKVVGGDVTIEVGFGGTAAKYALRVHEWTDPEPNWSEPGTGPKYLERPFNAMRSKLPAEISASFRRDLKDIT